MTMQKCAREVKRSLSRTARRLAEAPYVWASDGEVLSAVAGAWPGEGFYLDALRAGAITAVAWDPQPFLRLAGPDEGPLTPIRMLFFGGRYAPHVGGVQ